MWMLDFLPDWIFHLVVLVGIAGVILGQFFTFIPFIQQYLLPLRVVSIIILAAGLYFEGGMSNNDRWLAKVHEMELKVKTAEAKSAETTTKVVTKYVDKVRIVKEKQDVRVEYIDRYITKDADAKCDVPNSFVVLHDSASKNELPPTAGGAYEGTSNFKISEVGKVVTDNYTTCYQVREQLRGLQIWLKKQQAIAAEVK